MKKLTIATRGSKLALWQANHIKSCIESRHENVSVDLKVIKTKGDKILDVPLAKIGGKGLFVKEIEEAIMDGSAQLAVHSMKDVPMDLPEGMELFAIPEAEEPNDAFISNKAKSISDLPEGAVVGTSSLRRKVQLLAARGDLNIKDLRGNVDTRLRKLADGEFDAIILAKSGLKRLGLSDVITDSIDVDEMLPAVCQGVLGIEVSEDDDETKELLKFLIHEPTKIRSRCERAYLKKLEGGCQAPIAGHSVISGDTITMTGLVASIDGRTVIRKTATGKTAEPEKVGIALAEDVLSAGADKILQEIYGQ